MSRPTLTLVGQNARKAVLEGVNAVYIPTRMTFGPQGKNALLYRSFNRGNRITNDGVTVATCQEPKNVFQRLAAEAFKEACKKTNERVGDGTTATAIIGGKLFNDVYAMLSETQSEFVAKPSKGVMTLRKNILESAKNVKKLIKEKSHKIETIEDLEKIAIVSVEDEELGKLIAKMAWEVGVDGFIDVTEGYKGEIETEIIKGMRFPAKVGAKAFVNSPARYEMVAVDSPVLITNYALNNAAEFGSVFQKLNAVTSKIIVIAPAFSENVLVNMVNATKQGYFFYPVLTPSLRTEQYEDVAIYCGATFIDKNKGKQLRNIRPEDLGFLEKLVVKDTEAKEDAMALGGKGTREETKTDIVDEEENGKKLKVSKERLSSAVKDRIEVLKGQLAESTQDNFRKLLERRIASMGSAVGVIRVGDSTQASSLYRKLKIEDAVFASKAALRGGYVKGGGLCLKEIADTLPEEDILKSALQAPYEQIQSSVDGGIDISDDIIDATEAIYYAVEHATSVVANLATVEIITQEQEDMQLGEGELAIAKALTEDVLVQKRHYGMIKENEEEMERDRLKGLTMDEHVYFDGEYLN